MTAAAPRFRPAFPLVEAKLEVPAPRAGTVDRPRLMALLTAVPAPPVVSVVAPPGYGKTTLLAQWAAHEQRPVAWLTLDDLDNDPAHLLSYLAAALDRIEPIDPAIGSAVAAPRQRLLATAVPHLASELHRLRRPIVIILEDAHRLVDRTSLDALTGLIDHLPAGVQVAIAARTEPDLPFARLRAQRDLLEIGPELLALDAAETAALAARTGREVDADQARALATWAEGWAAAIYLAAISRDRGDGSALVVSGRDRYIEDYLRLEFESGLDDADIAFLTRTSILETIAVPVAEAVSALPGADERLRSLARGNLLIRAIGREPSYRYHNLLRDFLRAELERREPGTRAELHRRAASWYAAAGDIDRAVEHAVAGGDADGAGRLVTAAALSTLYGGRVTVLERWLEAFGRDDFARNPPLAIIAAWIHLLNGRAEASDRMADLAERATFSGAPGDGSASFESGRAMLRAVMARNGSRDMLANAEFAVSQEAPESPWRTNALWLLGSAQRLRGDVDAADATLADAVAAGGSAGASAALGARATIAIARGHWLAAEAFVAQSRDRIAAGHHEELLASLIVSAVGARVAIYRGDLARGRAELVRAQLVRPLATHVAPWYSVHALLEIARAYLAISDPAGARVVLREAEQIVRQRPGLGILTDELVDMRRRLAGAASTLAGSSTLTAGELRVLPFLPTYLSFQDIADRLSISRNTVKSHAMSIYGKLWASSRGEAVERAVEIGLLEPYPVIVSPMPQPSDEPPSP